MLHYVPVAEVGQPRAVASVPVLYACFRTTTTENVNIARPYKNHIKHTSNINRPDKPQLIITLVNSIGANKVKRQTSNINKILIPNFYSLYSSFSFPYFHFKLLAFISHKNTVKVSLKSVLVVNEEAGNVLPASIRQFKASWENGSALVGNYKAVLMLHYGHESAVVTSELTFWVFPWKMVAAIAAGSLILIVILVLLLKRFCFSIARR